MISYRVLALSLMICCLLGWPATAVQAQDMAATSGVAENLPTDDDKIDPNIYVGLEETFRRNTKLRSPDVAPGDFKTLFFTLWQHVLLQEAKRTFRTRRPNPAEMQRDAVVPQEERPRGIRELALSGILYKTGDDWIVWLNGQRVTPDAIPSQVIDIQVSNDYIELKWFDEYTNLIYPVRLQPHQRFNLDTRIFLPGVSASSL